MTDSAEPGCTCGGMAACPQCQERDAATAHDALADGHPAENDAGWDRRSDPSIRAMIDAEKEALSAEKDTPYDPCHGDPRAGWYGAHGAWEPCPVCDPTTPIPPEN